MMLNEIVCARSLAAFGTNSAAKEIHRQQFLCPQLS
jgi:hypothetical protein